MSNMAMTDLNRDALENQFGLADRVVDEQALTNTVDRFRDRAISLPTPKARLAVAPASPFNTA